MTIEAFFRAEGGKEGDVQFGENWIRRRHEEFVALYRMGPHDIPLLTLHTDRWQPGPFT